MLSCSSPIFVTLWTVAHQAPLSMGFSRQEYQRGCHALLQGIFLTQGSNLMSPALAGGFFTTSATWEALLYRSVIQYSDSWIICQKSCSALASTSIFSDPLSLFSSVQSLSHIQLFVTPWTTARQASLSITNSRSPPKPMSIESVMPSNHLILCRPLLIPIR